MPSRGWFLLRVRLQGEGGPRVGLCPEEEPMPGGCSMNRGWIVHAQRMVRAQGMLHAQGMVHAKEKKRMPWKGLVP